MTGNQHTTVEIVVIGKIVALALSHPFLDTLSTTAILVMHPLLILEVSLFRAPAIIAAFYDRFERIRRDSHQFVYDVFSSCCHQTNGNSDGAAIKNGFSIKN